MNEVIMPKLGQTVEEALIECWHKKEGDTIEKGDVLLEITTDKATLEVESFYSGTIRKALYQEGETVPVNSIIAFIGELDETIPEVAPPVKKESPSKSAPPPAEKPAPAPAPPKPAVSLPRDGRIFISPRARKRSEELEVPYRCLSGSGPGGRIIEQDVIEYESKRSALKVTPVAQKIAYQRDIDLLALNGTGPNGKITKEDVEQAEPVSMAGGRTVQLTAMRRIIAERMTESKSTVPHFYIDLDVDMSQAIILRGDLNAQGRFKVSFNDFLMRACTLAFRHVPEMNVTWGGDALIYRDQVDIGLAVAVDEGLLVPTLRDLNRLSIDQIAAGSADLIERTRTKRLTPDDYGNASMTISNLGMFGVERVFPIINPGESCILGVGRIAEKVAVKNGGIHIRNMMTLVLAADHRVVDGAIAARFLQGIKAAMETPADML
ncbi:MAG: dihydrolipoamide acetyltransferase family protein [Planctomycetota bacterium]|jgi:pyruvate dehydrogenase E2 component (dihydrolipoamide acetyltransferase)|nr:dihydrolipoamide acetyltransferase family protein [Planctomycetota bacterium]